LRAFAAFVCGLAVAAGCRARWDGVLTSLSDPDPRQRAEAVRRVGQTGNPEELSSLILRVDDPAPEVRGAIAQALGGLDNRQSSDALAALVTDESESVQLEAAAALVRHRDSRAHHYLLLAYQQDGPLVRARIAQLLKASGGSPAEAVSAEADALYTKDSEELAGSGPERLIAAERLGSSGRPEAIGRLTSYLGAESRSLAVAAARGLGASGAPEARGPLEAMLNEDDPGLRLAGAEALGELGDPQAALALSRAIQQNDLVSRAALRSLVRLKSPSSAGDLLCAVVMGSDPALSRQAATAIKGRGASCSVEKLKARLFRGGDVSGVLAGIAVLWSKAEPGAGELGGEMERAHLSAALGSLLRNGSPQVRPLAARAIGALGLASLAGDLERARKEAGLEVQRARERWIKSTGDTPSLFSPDPPAAVALWAETTLAMLELSAPEASAAASASQLLMAHDPAATVRVAAAEAIPWCPADKQWELLEPLLDDSDPAVREAARAVLPQIDLKTGAAGPWLLAELKQTTSLADGVPLVEALGHLGGLPGLEQTLVEALEQPDTAPAAARELAVVEGPVARAAILSHLRQPFALALPELLDAVAGRPSQADHDAAEACRALLFHSRPEVRAAAVRALKAIEGANAAAEVQPLAVDYDVRVRRAVASP